MASKQTKPTTLAEILKARGSEYGKFSTHAAITQELKNVAKSYPGYENLNAPQREALAMIFHKVGRIVNGNPNNVDSWADIAGYAQLVADLNQGVDN